MFGITGEEKNIITLSRIPYLLRPLKASVSTVDGNRLLMLFLFSFFISCFMTQCILLTGIITSFGLWLDGVQILNSSSTQRFFVVDGLEPWSRHILRLQACTARGCGKGPMVSPTTKHSLIPTNI